jgi:hypothetical protein
LAFEDEELVDFEKKMVMLQLLYPEMPENTEKAFELGMRFMDGDKESNEDSGPGYRLYSFEKDSNIIFSAFRQTHGIDLQRAVMHWWEFLALFMDLGADTTFCQLTALRKRIKDGTASEEERKIADSMGDMFVIEEYDARTLEEKIADAEFMAQLEGVN